MNNISATRPALVATALALSFLFAACGGDATPTPQATREDVLVALADGLYVPAYEAAAEAADRFATSIDTLNAEPNGANLDIARNAWIELRSAWSYTLAFDFGPTEKRRSMSLVDYFPVDTERLEETLGERDSFTAEEIVEFIPASARGLGAVEYVMFSDESEEDLLAELQADNGRRLRFLQGNAQAIKTELDAVALEWQQETDNGFAYRDVMTGDAPVSLFVNGAITEAVRGPVFLLEEVADMQIAPAIGLRGGGVDLSGTPSLPSGYAVEDIRSRLLSARDVYTGANGEVGLSVLIEQMSEDTDTRMRQALDDALAAVDAVSLPFDEAAVDDPESLQAVFDGIKAVQQVLNTEVVSLLGVSTGFSDNDGDSSS